MKTPFKQFKYDWRFYFILFLTILGLLLSVLSSPAHARLTQAELTKALSRAVVISDTDGDLPRISLRGNMGVETNEEERLELGLSFISSKRFTDVQNGETETLFLTNPDTSSRNAVGILVRSNASAKMELDIFSSVNEDSRGVTVLSQNARIGADTKAMTLVFRGGGYSSLGEPLFESIVPGGGTTGLQIGGESQASTFFVPPGENMLLRATNTSGGGEDLVLNVKWIEFK